MNTEKLRSLIRESIQEYIKEIDSAGTTAMYEAKMKACDEAIEKRMKKIEMAESLEEMQGMFDESKMKDLKTEIKVLEKQKDKYGKMLEKLNKGKEVVTEEPTEEAMEAPVEEADITAEMTDDAMTEGKKKKNKKDEKETMNESFLKMQKLAGVITEAQYNQKKKLFENQMGTKYLVIVNFEGQSDELGNMNGISASSKDEFENKFKNMFNMNPNDPYFSFYEASNQAEMDKITSTSDSWSGDKDETQYLENIVKQAKPYNKINF